MLAPIGSDVIKCVHPPSVASFSSVYPITCLACYTFDMTTALCIGPNCNKPVHVKSLAMCDGHYRQHKKGQELAAFRVPVGTCTFTGCTKPHMANGLCDGHDRQQKRGQELRPLAAKRTRGESAIEMTRGVRTCVGKHGCGRTLPLSQFSKHRRTADGYVTNCKECSRNVHLQWKYGMTQAEWDALFASQGHRCAICQVTDTYKWATDHDHNCCPGQKTCGRCVRAILCYTCNTSVGAVEAHVNPAALLEYVARYQRAIPSPTASTTAG